MYMYVVSACAHARQRKCLYAGDRHESTLGIFRVSVYCDVVVTQHNFCLRCLQELTRANADANAIMRALRHYIKCEEKDRLHTLNHYRHMQVAAEEGPDSIHQQETIREQALDHMEIINQRIQQAVNMLSRQPSMQQDIRRQIGKTPAPRSRPLPPVSAAMH